MNPSQYQLDLPALDGANPLGFLAALGTITVLAKSDRAVSLGWKCSAHWVPFLQSPCVWDRDNLLKALVEALRGKAISAEANDRLREAARHRDQAKKQLKQAREQLSQMALRKKTERDQARRSLVGPAEAEFVQARKAWLAALKDAVPSPELALGQRPDCTVKEFRTHALEMRAERPAAAALAALGVEASTKLESRIIPTPFCFIPGSGRQWFLDTARDLMGKATPEKLHEALFEPWAYKDEKLSMRWDPAEDVRYALQLNDPGPEGAHTVWMANLLAYRALELFPCVATGRGLAQAGWSGQQEPETFTWPIWQKALSLDTIRSLLWHPAFGEPDPTPWTQELRARGVAAVYRSRRIKVGIGTNVKINFTPAVPLF